MVLAHLPAGYILSSFIRTKHPVGRLFGLGLLGSVFPDFDLLYFYLLDHQQTFHRQYVTHLPFFWASITCLAIAFCLTDFGQKYRLAFLLFLSNVWLHLMLDSLIAPVYWLYPFSTEGLQLLSLNMERRYDYWLWNYLLNPIMFWEGSICVAAGALWILRRRKSPPPQGSLFQDNDRFSLQ